MAKSKNLADAIRRKLAKDPDLADAVEDARWGFNVSAEVFRIRTQAGLTQRQLADKIGTHQSVIARLEDADYDGHSLKLLRRIAESVGLRVEVRFVADIKQDETPRPTAAMKIFEPTRPTTETDGGAAASESAQIAG